MLFPLVLLKAEAQVDRRSLGTCCVLQELYDTHRYTAWAKGILLNGKFGDTCINHLTKKAD